MKKTDQTIYVCDGCKKEVIANYTVQQKATKVGIASYGAQLLNNIQVPIDLAYCRDHDSIHFSEMNTFLIPYVQMGADFTPSGIDYAFQAGAVERHLCKECAEKTAPEYFELCDAFRKWSKDNGINLPSAKC